MSSEDSLEDRKQQLIGILTAAYPLLPAGIEEVAAAAKELGNLFDDWRTKEFETSEPSAKKIAAGFFSHLADVYETLGDLSKAEKSLVQSIDFSCVVKTSNAAKDRTAAFLSGITTHFPENFVPVLNYPQIQHLKEKYTYKLFIT